MRFERFRNCLCALLPALCAALLLPACAAKEDGGDAPADYFDVRLVEYTGDSQELFLGGGSWDNDGSGVIPEGGLTRHYRGPCPPTGSPRDYAFVVSAMHRGNMQPLSVRIYRFTQE